MGMLKLQNEQCLCQDIFEILLNYLLDHSGQPVSWVGGAAGAVYAIVALNRYAVSRGIPFCCIIFHT